MAPAAFSKWLTDDKALATHWGLSGYKLAVPDRDVPEFHALYARTVLDNRPLDLVEVRPERFKMYVDIDYVRSPGEELTESLVSEIIACVNSIMKPADDRVIELVTDDQLAKDPKDTTIKIKTGRHLVWTGLVVTAAEALALRDAALQRLKRLNFKPTVDLDKVFDPSVYHANGLRMPWSAKVRASGSVTGSQLTALVDPDKAIRSIYVPKRLHSKSKQVVIGASYPFDTYVARMLAGASIRPACCM